jgi:spore germination cell wall hydrolase CwlJ-like protein
MMGDEGLTAVPRVNAGKLGRAVRAAALCAGTAVIVTVSTGSTAYQDMTSLLDGAKQANRWQAFFVPSPAGSIEEAEIAFAGPRREQLPEGAGVRSGDGSLFTLDAPQKAFAAPDESRVRRAEKGARVISLAPAQSLPPRGFSAGSILERQSLLGPRVIGPAERVRLAFSKVTQTTQDAMTVAMNFQLKGPPKILDDEPVMLAALKPSTADDAGALGYAPSGRASSLFENILREQPEAFVPPIGDKDHAWAATPLAASAFSAKEQSCLANGIYFEARGESTTGQAAVAQVILNRVRNPAFPKTICGVVYQNKNWRNRCQFSFACDGTRDRVADRGAWSRAKRVAEQVTKGDIWLNDVGSATHYHATYVNPRWAGAMERVDKIGKHIFYRTFNGGW